MTQIPCSLDITSTLPLESVRDPNETSILNRLYSLLPTQGHRWSTFYDRLWTQSRGGVSVKTFSICRHSRVDSRRFGGSSTLLVTESGLTLTPLQLPRGKTGVLSEGVVRESRYSDLRSDYPSDSVRSQNYLHTLLTYYEET